MIRKSLVFIIQLILVIMFFYCFSSAKVTSWTNFYIAGIQDDNVYKTSDFYNDTGGEINLNLGLRSKLSDYTFGRFSYNFLSRGFSTYNVENKNIHSLFGLLKQRFGKTSTLDLKGGYKTYQFPNITIQKYLITQNSQKLYFRPNFDFYPTKYTTIRAEYIYEDMVYPDYDFDYINTGYSAKFAQEILFYTYLEFFTTSERLNYSERYLYTIIESSRALTDTSRYDDITTLKLRLTHDFLSLRNKVILTYEQEQLKSNGNYFDYGPNQFKYDNTTFGDERVVEDYYSYDSSLLSLSVRQKLGLEHTVRVEYSHKDKQYLGRLAKDENDEFKTPEQKRHDQKTILSAIWSITLSKNSTLKLSYSNENNNSNEYFYDYTNNIISIGIDVWLLP